MDKEVVSSVEKPSLFLVGSGEEITAILQKTPTRVLHLTPDIRGGWKIEKEFSGENWQITEGDDVDFFVCTRSRAGGHPIGHTSEPFPAYKHPQYS